MVLLAAVEFLLEKIKELLLYHTHLISGHSNQFDELERYLCLFKSFLREHAAASRPGDDDRQEIIRQIHDLVYEAEDTIDALVTQATESKSKNYFLKAFQTQVNLQSVNRDAKAVCSRIQDVYGDKARIDFTSFIVGDEDPEASEVPWVRQDNLVGWVRQDNVVGFEDEAAKLIGYLMEETEQLDVISIIGMAGLGKTTLARKIFCNPRIQYEFPTRIWVYVSRDFTKKNIFLSILRQFTRLSDNMYCRSDQELAKLVNDYLERGKFLIVMDDMWTAEDWDKLKVALPMNNDSGKVLITSRQEEVARHANCYRLPHKMRFLNAEESWLLLQWEVFGEPKCPPELEGLGKVISGQCDGLPLAIVVIGGILAAKNSPSEERTAISNAWRKVSESVNTYPNEDREGRVEKIISLSYDKLPYHLRACFLYFGMFPEDFEIPVWKLIRMWIAEGFIPQKPGVSLEETAENYLEELIKRNLIRIDKMSPNDRVKTCRIHDMLRGFCKTEAGRENFLQEVKKDDDGVLELHIRDLQKCRRLCVHSNVLNFISSKPFGPRVRSFVCMSKDEIILPTEHISTIPAAFKLLRVLDVNPIKFTKIPFDLYHSVHLRYIALSFNLAVLPAAFSKLWNIQTLIVDTTSRTLEIKADIWKMRQLRHLKTNASTTLPKTEQSSKEGENLQTLGTISPQNCTEEVFYRARNLKKLGIRGRLAWLFDGKIGSFDCLGKLANLDKLKLLNDVSPSPPREGRLPGLPPPYKFPPKLRILTLSDTFLDWSHMSVLGSLENLEVLKLKNNAFMGKHWETRECSFPHLQVLRIEHTNLVSWMASHHHFPGLRCLELRYCKELEEIPIGLADIPSLKLLDLYFTKHAAASAKKIYKAKREQEKQTIEVSRFKLSIFPPDERSPRILS